MRCSAAGASAAGPPRRERARNPDSSPNPTCTPQVRALKLLQEEEAAAAARGSAAALAEAAALRRAAAAGAARTVAAEARAAELLAALRERDGRLAAAAAELDSLRGRLAGAGRRGEALEARLRAQEARAAAAEAQARAAALRARQQARARLPGPGGRPRHLAIEFASVGGGSGVHLTRACVFCDVQTAAIGRLVYALHVGGSHLPAATRASHQRRVCRPQTKGSTAAAARAPAHSMRRENRRRRTSGPSPSRAPALRSGSRPRVPHGSLPRAAL